MDSGSRGDLFVRSLAKGLTVIEIFNRANPALTLTEVAKAVGISRAAARRILHTLVELGYASFNGKLFRLTPQVLGLGYAYLSSLTLPDVAQPIMNKVVDEVQESCSASVLDGFDVIYIARAASRHRIMSITLNVGTRLPAYATSMGRVLLAGLAPGELDHYLSTAPMEPCTERTITHPARLREVLDDIRAQGYAIVDQELEMGLISIAVPVVEPCGTVIAALNVSTHPSRFSAKDAKRVILPILRNAVERISLAMFDHRIAADSVRASRALSH